MLHRFHGEGVHRKSFDVAVDPRSNPILGEVCSNVVEPLLADCVKEEEHPTADGLALM